MDPGHVITARGMVLNMDELRLKSRKPLIDTSNIDMKDKVEKRPQPVKQLNVRGFMPSMEGVAKPHFAVVPQIKQEQAQPTGPSLADLTGVTVDNPRYLKERPENPAQLANETLREIIGDLDEYKNREAPQDKRRTKK